MQDVSIIYQNYYNVKKQNIHLHVPRRQIFKKIIRPVCLKTASVLTLEKAPYCAMLSIAHTIGLYQRPPRVEATALPFPLMLFAAGDGKTAKSSN